MRVLLALLRYPMVVVTLVVAAVAGVLSATPASVVAPWLLGGWALAVAAWSLLGMLRDLLRGHAGIDVLAVIAITATVLVGEHWAAIIVVLMLTGGEALEDYAAQRAKHDLAALLDRAPSLAHRVTPEGIEDVAVEAVAVGDALLVRPNELVPVDAELEEPGEFDLSSLTGESLPVELAVGQVVPSGALNGVRAVRVRAVRAAADSQYQGVVRLVEEASGSRPQVVRLADRYAVPFTLLSLAIAGTAWWVSGDPVRFAEVLVVATPCPLLIAAPVAFIAGMSRSARSGVVVKGGDVLERLSRVRTAVFDKTGTLTGGEPQLEQVRAADADRLLALAAAAEGYSTHVLAKAVIRGARDRGLAVPEATDARETATNGVEATVAGARVAVGKRAWIAGLVGESVEHEPLEPGRVGVYVAVDGRFAGTLVLRDQLRPEAAATVQAMRDAGAEVVMLTGDAWPTARHIAGELGIERVQAECLPADKVAAVQLADRPVVMIGDGINDAPVLAAADVGIAMGARGATAASESADAVVLVDDIAAVARVTAIARDTVRIALESIWLGIVISVGLMVVAAFGLLPAVVGAWLQEVVDLIAILGALRALGPRGERRASRAGGRATIGAGASG